MGTRLPAVSAARAADVAAAAELSPEAAALLGPDMAPGDYVDELRGRSLFADACRFLAFGLGRREAVWWACVCCRLAPDPKALPGAAPALAAAEAWCRTPSEENRRAAHAAAQAIEMAAGEAWASMGAFWSGGSLAPPDAPQAVPPGPFLTGKAVAAAVTIAAVRAEPEKAAAKFALFLERGIAVAQTPAAPARGA